MNKIQGARLEVRQIERHTHICDLINFDGPLLSLFSDHRMNWLYFWADTDNVDTNRWIVFSVGRDDLVAYLNKKVPLLKLISNANFHWVLDETRKRTSGSESAARRENYRILREASDLNEIKAYLPSEDSYFDESLTNDISMAQDMSPDSYAVPISGRWFIPDLDRFSRSYSHVYAFLYATRPQFVTNIRERLGRFMRAPWTGGYSRVNLFSAMEQLIPAVHGLQIRQMAYASPGDIRIEALRSVGEDIRVLTLRCAQNTPAIKDAVKGINQTLSDANLRRRNLSKMSDETVPIDQRKLVFLREKCAEIANALALNSEIGVLRDQAPNTVVFGKAVLAVVKQVERLVDFQRQGLLDLERAQ